MNALRNGLTGSPGPLSHQLRDPLSAIYFHTSNVADGLFGQLQPRQREHLAYALEHLSELKQLIDALLENITPASFILVEEASPSSPEQHILEAAP